MDLAIAERLICPEGHEPAPLIVRADGVKDGQLTGGALGCALCQQEWPVSNGVARFGPRRAPDVAEPTLLASPDATTIAALLGLTEPGAIVIADGLAGDVVEALSREFAARIVMLDGEAPAAAAWFDGAARVPLSAGVATGAVLLRADRARVFVSSCVHALAPGGRAVGRGEPVIVDGLRLVARGDGLWVAETVAVARTVPLRRRVP